MKVLVACEYSGIVRDAFAAKGNDAWSCDILDTESKGQHIKGDVLEHLDKGWKMMIAHPPCTHLANTGARWFTEGKKPLHLRKKALDFVRILMDAPIDYICIENPVSVISSHIREADQMIQPYEFGHKEYKKTCLWLFRNGLCNGGNRSCWFCCLGSSHVHCRIRYRYEGLFFSSYNDYCSANWNKSFFMGGNNVGWIYKF